MAEFTRPRGTRDFSPEDLAHRRALEALFRATLERFGYREVQTPTFEHTELFTAKSGEAVLDQIYAFEDKGERSLTLRPEVTAPVLRFYVNEMQHLPKPIKLYYYANCFRYERPQSGRYREFWQFGLELIGPDTPEGDAEVVGAAAACLQAAGLEGFQVRVGHIGALRAFVDDLPGSEDARAAVYRAIDKKDWEGLDAALGAAGAAPERADAIRAIAATAGEVPTGSDADAVKAREAVLAGARAAVEGSDAAAAAVARLEEVASFLDAFGLEAVEVDLGVARGLDYYTGTVFEIHHPQLGAESQICGGGAYALAELFGGESVGSVGFGMGFDRVLLALEAEGRLPGEAAPPRVFVAPIGDDAVRHAALALVNRLRREGVAADVDLTRRGPSKNLDYANSLGAPYVALLGGRELEQGVVTLKDMASGEQEQVPLDDVAARLGAR